MLSVSYHQRYFEYIFNTGRLGTCRVQSVVARISWYLSVLQTSWSLLTVLAGKWIKFNITENLSLNIKRSLLDLGLWPKKGRIWKSRFFFCNRKERPSNTLVTPWTNTTYQISHISYSVPSVCITSLLHHLKGFLLTLLCKIVLWAFRWLYIFICISKIYIHIYIPWWNYGWFPSNVILKWYKCRVLCNRVSFQNQNIHQPTSPNSAETKWLQIPVVPIKMNEITCFNWWTDTSPCSGGTDRLVFLLVCLKEKWINGILEISSFISP